MARSPNAKQITQESGFYGPYSHFSRTLRAWLVAYGIGGPVLLVSQDHLSGLVLNSGVGLYISTLFLGGVAIQIFAALLYKYSMGIIYASELDPDIEETTRFKVAEWLSDAFWLEFVFDIASISCFILATFTVLRVVVG